MMVKQLLGSFYNWLFPTKCVLCNNIDILMDGTFCSECFAKITTIEDPICNKCGKLFTTGMPINAMCNECEEHGRLFIEARSLLLYDKFTQKIILSIKNNADENIAYACCRLLFNKYIELFDNIDFIVPVPSHWVRTLYRGFNPADIIAKELSIVSGIEVNRSLRRIRYTAYQHKKNKAERLNNLNNAFACNNMSFYNKNVLLVDDVFSTGSTLNECTRALLQAGVKSVKCATIASTAADYYNKNPKSQTV